MKISILNIFQGKTERGLETYVSELKRRLEKNHSVDIYEGKSRSLTRWPILWRFYLDPHGLGVAAFTAKLLPRIWKEKYDIVFALNGGWQPALVRIITWIYGGRMIIPGQSGKGWDERNNLWCFPDIFVALSIEAKKWAEKVNPMVMTTYIPNGVDLDQFKPGGERFKTGLKTPIVICQGAAEHSKRLHLAIDAVARLKGVSLLILGKGLLSKSIFKLGKKLLGDRFEMTTVPHRKMPSVYRLGKVFTLPSQDSEAFGISIVEAMAANLPVVVTDNAIRREIVGDNAGIFVNPEDIDSYSQSIGAALDKNWGDKPRRQAEKFSWDKVSEKYEELFKKLVG